MKKLVIGLSILFISENILAKTIKLSDFIRNQYQLKTANNNLTNEDISIPAEVQLVIDKDVDIGFVNLEGQVRCPETGNFTIRTTGIHIHGKNALLECGTANKKFKGKIRFEFKEGYSFMESERSFVLMDGGTLRLFGESKNANWVNLAKTTNSGDRILQLNKKINWSVGDRIMISPTNFRVEEAEEFTIQSVSADQLSVTLTEPMRYSHWGQNQVDKFSIGNHKWILDESAEVANLSRNIIIMAEGSLSSLNYNGAHLMVMKSAKAYLDSVEFYQMGQMGKMGRYPFHWHLAGDVNGQFIVNSSIHHSFQRCVTLHGTNRALVKNNVCFDHYGHGFFLEDGNEIENKIIGNLGVLSRVPLERRRLLFSDSDRSQSLRFAGPATFWISNPNNNVSGNIAAGSQGTGFWMSFSDALYCVEDGIQPCRIADRDTPKPNRFPRTTSTLRFDNNKASVAMVGITWDGAPDGELTQNTLNPNDRKTVSIHYAPPSTPVYSELKMFKTLIGIYFRGNTVKYLKSIFADNMASLFFAYNQIVTDSLIVGFSSNFRASDLSTIESFRLGKPSGVLVYDGPFELNRVDFVNFPSQRVSYNGQDYTPTPFMMIGAANRFANSVNALTFNPEPYRRLDFGVGTNWADSRFSTSVRDIDGSLSGSPNSLIVPDEEFNFDSSCKIQTRSVNETPITGAFNCNYKLGLLLMNQFMPYVTIRSDGPISVPYADKNLLNSKVNLILNSYHDYEYQIDIKPSGVYCPAGGECINWDRPKSFAFNFQTEEQGQLSPIIEFLNVGSCVLRGQTSFANLEQLRNASSIGYSQNGKNLYVKIKSTIRVNPDSVMSRTYESGFQRLDCL
jgi:cell migration-inducing and hyaluronan-binding protein